MRDYYKDMDKRWYEILKAEFSKDYFISLEKFLSYEYASYTIYPPQNLLFNAFKQTLFDDTKVVILGQDPYHNKGQSHGLAFSVPDGIKIPPSLRNIYKEINSDLGIEIAQSGNLLNWTKQGVLLLNTVLSVRENSPGSHQKQGWEDFTNNVILKLSEYKENLVFILWGSKSFDKEKLINKDKHLILKAVHPSPLSAYRGFFGCKHFSQANNYLENNNIKGIDWSV